MKGIESEEWPMHERGQCVGKIYESVKVEYSSGTVYFLQVTHVHEEYILNLGPEKKHHKKKEKL